MLWQYNGRHAAQMNVKDRSRRFSFRRSGNIRRGTASMLP
jgi:hypothetical protein